MKRLWRNDVTASKPFKKGYQIYHIQKVQNVAVHWGDTDSYDIVRAAVMPSQRQDREYKTAVAIYTQEPSEHEFFGSCPRNGSNHLPWKKCRDRGSSQLYSP